ncbi:MAG: endonuclease/exonuclease/phosphatase family protein [Cyclobacteriaceae bacterium]
MNKQTLRLFFALLLITTSCQEEISPLFRPSKEVGDNNNSTPTEPVEGKYADCLSVLSNSTFDIATWNIENFPKTSTTLNKVKEIISTMDPDVIAVQEITSLSLFNNLISELPGWQGTLMSSGSQRLGYLFKSSEIQSVEGTEELFTNDNCPFPRPVLKTKVRHVSGKEIFLMNVHLKCCSDATASCGSASDRRRQASEKMKSYIDQNLSTSMVIVLGDWNDGISDPNNPFSNFIADQAGYKFSDLEIAKGPQSGWSYPGWPSHLDHILVSNELFSLVKETRTLKLNICESSYFDTVSDHYPVMLRLN